MSSPQFEDVLMQKITSLQRCVFRARDLRQRAGAEFSTSFDFQDAAVLNVLRACETAIDLANMLLRKDRLGIPSESREAFAILARERRISAELDRLFAEHEIGAVMNFASFIEVGASVKDPSAYYRNNVGNTLELLDAMARHDVRHLIFSSTAAIFGDPEYTPIDEVHPKVPINPYGRSKWLIEQLLPDYEQAYGLKSVCLRYFNAAGADPDGRLGERHQPETHLIPLVLQAASGRREAISIFGTDYPTPDGTCVRDYIHVEDLDQAHLRALEYLETGADSAAFNLGNGNGFSIREVIDTARALTGRDFPVIEADRRPGDPAVLVADSARARSELGWQPEFADLATIVSHDWAWEQAKGSKW